MSRILGIAAERASVVVRIAYWMSKRMVGKVAEPLQVTAHHPGIFRAYGAFEYFLGRSRKVDAKLKTLASIKAATLVGCPF